MCERQKQSTTTIHCFLDSNQWTVFAYSQFIAFFCLAGTDLSVIWAAVGALVTLTTKSALSLCWCAVKPAAAVSFVAAKLNECSNRLPHVLPLATRAGSPGRPARSFHCLSSCPQTSHHQQWPEATRHLLHEWCWFYCKTLLLWVMVHFMWALWWRPRTITHIDGIHFICEENTGNITHKNGPQAWVSQWPGWKKACVFAPQRQVDGCIDCHREQQSTTSSMGPVDTRVCTENQNLKLSFRTYGHRSHHGVLHLDEGPERALFNTITVSPYCGVSSGSAAS